MCEQVKTYVAYISYYESKNIIIYCGNNYDMAFSSLENYKYEDSIWIDGRIIETWIDGKKLNIEAFT